MRAAIAALIEALKDKDPTVRLGAASTLGVIQPQAQDAVPALVDTLTDTDNRVRNAAAGALCNLGETKEAIGVLIEALKDDSDMFSDWAATMLGLIGPGAKPAIPCLIEALKDKKDRVRAAAATA